MSLAFWDFRKLLFVSSGYDVNASAAFLAQCQAARVIHSLAEVLSKTLWLGGLCVKADISAAGLQLSPQS